MVLHCCTQAQPYAPTCQASGRSRQLHPAPSQLVEGAVLVGEVAQEDGGVQGGPRRRHHQLIPTEHTQNHMFNVIKHICYIALHAYQVLHEQGRDCHASKEDLAWDTKTRSCVFSR